MKSFIPIAIFILSLLDDALLLGLSQFGFHIPGLQQFSPIILGGIFLYMGVHLLHHRSRINKFFKK